MALLLNAGDTVSRSYSYVKPSPTHISTPEECGDRTANLFDVAELTWNSGILDDNGQPQSSTASHYTGNYIAVEPNTNYYFSGTLVSGGTAYRFYYYDSAKQWISRNQGGSRTFTTPANCYYMKVQCSLNISAPTDWCLVKGSTAPSEYEPYGYKLPITNAGTTYNVYLSEPLRKIGDYKDKVRSDGVVERKIKKLVLTGEEDWVLSAGDFFSNCTDSYSKQFQTPICSHLQGDTKIYISTGENRLKVFVSQLPQELQTLNAWKQYLATQYANGTPVCVWYVLATPVSDTATFPTITPTQGSNTLSVNTTLAPSAITLTATSGVWPKNPIQPEEFGERTANLYDKTNPNVVRAYYKSQTNEIAANENNAFVYVPIEEGMTYYISGAKRYNQSSPIRYCTTSQIPANGVSVARTGSFSHSDSLTITAQSGESYLSIFLCGDGDYSGYGSVNDAITANSENMVIDNGYKIPITNAGTTYNIFLNEPLRKIGDYADVVNSDGTVMRRIKKKVLTGQETCNSYQYSTTNGVRVTDVLNTTYRRASGVCSIYPVSTQAGTTYCLWIGSGGGDRNLYFISVLNAMGLSTAADFKSYLAQQYTNGTPVTVWYVLSTPTTETVTAPEIATTAGTNTLTIGTSLAPSETTITGHIKPTEWYKVREAVRNGVAPTKYPVGTILYDNFDSSTGTAFQVVGYDKHFDPALTAQGYTHSMTLCQLKLDLRAFDNTEAFLYLEHELPAGTYRFTIPNYDASYGGNKTYYFTSTGAVPVGGQIVMSWPYNQTPKTVSAYTSQTSTTAITGFSALTLTEWVDGTSPQATDIGTIAGPTSQTGSSTYGKMNHIHRARYGSNNYYQSGLRQWMNASGTGGTWWEPQTIFDRPYGNRTNDGYLSTLNPDMVGMLGTPTIESLANSYFETASLDGTTFTTSQKYTISTDKMFAFSPVEVGFSTTDTSVGTLMNYYANATNDTRIKYRKDTGAAYYWWLRTPYPSYAHIVRHVNSSGALSSNYANNTFGVAPACIIQ